VAVLLSKTRASSLVRAESPSGRERRSLEDKTSLVRLVSAPIEGENSDKLAWARLLRGEGKRSGGGGDQ
jgi:hypothetical protein